MLEEADVLPLLREPAGHDALLPRLQVHGLYHRAAAPFLVWIVCPDVQFLAASSYGVPFSEASHGLRSHGSFVLVSRMPKICLLRSTTAKGFLQLLWGSFDILPL